MQALQDEMSVMSELSHPHLIGLHEIYKTGDASDPYARQQYYIVMELMRGCELFDRIVQKEYYNEREARDVCAVLFDALSYCHARNIAHRDLKPENLLLANPDDDASVKIADFGFSKRMPEEGYLTLCGSPSYVAPEVLNASTMGSYDVQCDVWSLGVIVYILLGGYCPFGDTDDERVLYSRIKACEYKFHDEFWGSVSDAAKDFIRCCLQPDPAQRHTASQALQHPWLNPENRTSLQEQDLAAGLQALKAFNAKRKFRAAVVTLIAAQKLTGMCLALTLNKAADENDEPPTRQQCLHDVPLVSSSSESQEVASLSPAIAAKRKLRAAVHTLVAAQTLTGMGLAVLEQKQAKVNAGHHELTASVHSLHVFNAKRKLRAAVVTLIVAQTLTLTHNKAADDNDEPRGTLAA